MKLKSAAIFNPANTTRSKGINSNKKGHSVIRATIPEVVYLLRQIKGFVINIIYSNCTRSTDNRIKKTTKFSKFLYVL